MNTTIGIQCHHREATLNPNIQTNSKNDVNATYIHALLIFLPPKNQVNECHSLYSDKKERRTCCFLAASLSILSQ